MQAVSLENCHVKNMQVSADDLYMNAIPDLDAHIEFQLSLLRLTAATATAEKTAKAELWEENAQNLEKLAESSSNIQYGQPVRIRARS